VDTELGRFCLPVSGRAVVLRQPSGAEELLLREAAPGPAADGALALALAGRLGRANDGEPLDWGGLAVTDLDALVLRLRRALIGDRIRADIFCPAPGCGRRFDIDFGVEAFLAHHAPQTAPARVGGWVAIPADEPGWFVLARATGERGSVSFRLPTVHDQLAAVGAPDGADELARRCLRRADVPARVRRRVEALMEALAPSLAGDLRAACPECGEPVPVYFDARRFCLQELRDRAAFVYQDVDALARRYHWTENEILALPQVRRAAYAELARQAGGA
jgi:hypothetical protein